MKNTWYQLPYDIGFTSIFSIKELKVGKVK